VPVLVAVAAVVAAAKAAAAAVVTNLTTQNAVGPGPHWGLVGTIVT